MAKGKFNFIAPVKPANGEAVPASPSLTLTPSETVPPSSLKSEGEDNYLKTRLIPRGKIKNNPKNKYDMTDIESLAESILHYGLMQPLVVVYIMQDDVYMLETGHRRVAALNQLIDTYANWPDQNDTEYLLYKKYVKAFEKGFPCIVSAKIDDGIEYVVPDDDLANTDPDVIRSEIRLHLTNCEVREIDKARTIARLSKLYDALNRDKKKGAQININRQIAADMQMTERQVINYKNVRKLIPELQEAFEAKKITLKESSRIAQLNEDEQRTILNLLSENGDRTKIDELLAEKTALNNTLKELQKSLRDKTVELENLHKEAATLKENASNALPVSEADPQILKGKNEEVQKKDHEINQLKAQLDELKQEKLTPPPTLLSNESEKEIKTAIALKNSLESSKGALQNLVHIVKEFNGYENHTILSVKELEEELDDLLQLIINVAKE